VASCLSIGLVIGLPPVAFGAVTDVTTTPAAVASAAAGLATAPTAPTRAAAGTARGPVVLIGTGGLRWDDAGDTTPGLQSLLSEGAVGDLAVHGVRDPACPVDGWLAVSAGRPAADSGPGTSPAAPGGRSGCRLPAAEFGTAGGPATAVRWDVYRAQASTSSSGGSSATSSGGGPGLLGDDLSAHGISSAAVGAGAVLALADSAGLSDRVRAALATGPRLLVVDVGAVRDASSVARSEQVAALDSRIQLVLGELPAGATAVVASLADSGTPTHLQLLAAAGPAGTAGRAAQPFARRLLASPSTGQDGLARAGDLLPTLLDALGVTPPPDADGAPLRTVPADPDPIVRLEQVVDLDRAAQASRTATPWFLAGLAALAVLLAAAAALLLRRDVPPAGVPRRMRSLRVLRRAAVVLATVPAAAVLAGLVPWWRESTPGLAAALAVATFCLPLSLIALNGPWRSAPLGPAAVVGGLTALVLAGDLLTGSGLSLTGLIGLQPLGAGPLHGLNGSLFALLGTGALLAATGTAALLTAHARHGRAVLTVTAFGLPATVVDGLPGGGADAAGLLALVPAFGVLAVLLTGRLNGLVGPGWRGPRPVRVAYHRVPWLPAGLVALVVLTALGAVVHSDLAVPAVAALLAVPLLVAVVVRAVELDGADRLDAAVAAARRQGGTGRGKGRRPRVTRGSAAPPAPTAPAPVPPAPEPR
jgi:hypothetical protein